MGEARKILVKIVEYAKRLVGETEKCTIIGSSFGGVYRIVCGDGTVRITLNEAMDSDS